jgi:hypothetical protein
MLAEYSPETTESILVNGEVSGSVPEEQSPLATDLQRQICQVIEEIFSNENLAKDQFLKEIVEQTPEGCKLFREVILYVSKGAIHLY